MLYNKRLYINSIYLVKTKILITLLKLKILKQFDVACLFSGKTKIICPVCKTESNTRAIRPNHEKVLLVDSYNQQQQNLPTFDSTSESKSYFDKFIKFKTKLYTVRSPIEPTLAPPSFEEISRPFL